MDFDTKKLDLKKDDILMCNGKLITTISKIELLKPLYDEIKKDKKRISDLEIDNAQLLKDVRLLLNLEAGL